jgi:hypothetical protein
MKCLVCEKIKILSNNVCFKTLFAS